MSESRIKVADLRVKEESSSIFQIKYLNLMEARDGKKYLNIVLGDASGDLESRSWAPLGEEIYGNCQKGDFLKVKGRLNIFQGRKQFIIKDYTPVDSEKIDEKEFIRTSEFDSEEMFSDLMLIVERLDDYYIKLLLKTVLQEPEIQRRLKTWQAGKTIHHAYQGGLLEHILSCARLSETLSAHYNCNKNYVVAGAILHDLCKIYELTDGQNVEYTEEGKLVGHLVKALEIIDRYSYRIKNFPYNLKLHLKHIMLSHHGSYEYGSPKIPQSSEAMLVHLIDHMDSKLAAFDAIKASDNQTGHWTSYVKHLDRIIYKEELPFYSEPIEDQASEATSADLKPASKKQGKREFRDKDPKTSMGDLLKGIKID